MKSRSPLLGYNHNIRYGGRLFHVQTEDSGVNNPHIFTHLFHEGTILASKKAVYDRESNDDTVQKLMQTQHKSMLRDLRDGMFDVKIGRFFGGRPAAEPDDRSSSSLQPPSSASLRPPSSASLRPPSSASLRPPSAAPERDTSWSAVPEAYLQEDVTQTLVGPPLDLPPTEEELTEVQLTPDDFAPGSPAQQYAAELTLPPDLRTSSPPSSPRISPPRYPSEDTIPVPRLDLTEEQTRPILVPASRVHAPAAPPASAPSHAAPPASALSHAAPPQQAQQHARPPSHAMQTPPPPPPQAVSHYVRPGPSRPVPEAVPVIVQRPPATVFAPPSRVVAPPPPPHQAPPAAVPPVASEPARPMPRSVFDLPPAAGASIDSVESRLTPARVPAVPRKPGHVVVQRPGVVVGGGAPTRRRTYTPTHTPDVSSASRASAAAPPDPGSDNIFGDDPFSEKSLDEVILAYLSEDPNK